MFIRRIIRENLSLRLNCILEAGKKSYSVMCLFYNTEVKSQFRRSMTGRFSTYNIMGDKLLLNFGAKFQR